MSNSEPNQIEQMLQQGIEAAKSGDKAEARTLLEKVVEQDEHSELGWFWLAAVVTDDNEKRTCLGNVLVINPDNKRARRLLDQLENKQTTNQLHMALREEAGESRKSLYIAAAFAAGAVIVLVILIMMMGGGKKDGDTNGSDSNGALPPAIAAERTQQAATLPDTYTPTPSETPSPRPATWTPVPSSTPIPENPPTLFAPPPSSVTGWIIMQSGQVPGDPHNHPIAIIKPDGTDRRVIAPESSRGHAPVFSPNGLLYAYIKYAPGTRDVLLQIDNLQGTAPKSASAFWAGVPILSSQDAPAWSANGKWIVFTAAGMGTNIPDLYLVDVSVETSSPDALTRLTTDEAAESWPAFSPDSRRIVYAADLTRVQLDPATELRIYTLETSATADLTTNGAELTESAPDWSPDGQRIVFQAHAASDPAGDTDIYLMLADGAAAPQKIIDSDASDIQPRFSPDGKYIVFSSNRTGNWDVFVFDLTAQTYYQVTGDAQTDIANDWGG